MPLSFGTGSLALELALFGVVYRSSVRTDGDDTLKQSVVAVFAMWVTFLLADMPSRSGLLIAALAGLILGLLLERFRR